MPEAIETIHDASAEAAMFEPSPFELEGGGVVRVGRITWLNFGKMYAQFTDILQKTVHTWMFSQEKDAMVMELMQFRATQMQIAAQPYSPEEGETQQQADARKKADLQLAAERIEQLQGVVERARLDFDSSLKNLLTELISIPEFVQKLVMYSTGMKDNEVNELAYSDVLGIALLSARVNFAENQGVRDFFDGVKGIFGVLSAGTPSTETTSE